MNKPWPALVLAVPLCGTALHAQTNPPAPQSGTDRPLTQITSDSVDFDLKTRVAVYRGHVRVDDAKMKLTCDVLTAKVPEAGGGFDRIEAEQSVVIDAVDAKGETNHALADKMIYTYKIDGGKTNEVVELIGNPRLEAPQGTLTGDVIVWDRANNRVSATNMKMSFRTGGTNAFPALMETPADEKK
jgi:lipopolysaccharide transport protein LptA